MKPAQKDLLRAIRQAVQEEREACARVADECACAAINPGWEAAQRAIAREIRARGAK